MARMQQKSSSESLEKLATLLQELEKWNKKYNLTAIRNIQDMVGAHIMDSLSARPFIHGNSIIDVGTGAGFPGLPLAIVDSRLDFMLIDSNRKKIGFIMHIINFLELKNVTIEKIRAEDFFPAKGFDTVIARALSNVPNLISLTKHMLKDQGIIVALKGKQPIEELNKIPASWQYNLSKVAVPGINDHERHIVTLKQLGHEST